MVNIISLAVFVLSWLTLEKGWERWCVCVGGGGGGGWDYFF
jgi:hypothetical protein